MASDMRRDFPRMLRRAMASRGMDVRALHEAMGSVRLATVYHWVNGRSLPSLDLVGELRDALGCEWKDLLG